MPLLDGRPPAVDARFRPGNTFTVTLNWPAGALTGRTFTAALDATALTVNIVGDDMTVSMSEAQTSAAAAAGDFVLTEVTGGISDVVLVGSWHSSNGPSASEATTVSVNESSGVVTVIVNGAQGVEARVAALEVLAQPWLTIPASWGDQWAEVMAEAAARVVCVDFWGDSITDGVGASDANATAYVPKVIAALQAAHGDGGSGYFNVNKSTKTGTWTNAMGAGGAIATATAAASATWSTMKGVTIAIHYMNAGITGSFRYQVDGGSFTTVTTPSGLGLDPATVFITGLSDTTHTLRVEWVSGTVTIAGVEARRATGVIGRRFAISGRTATEFSAAQTSERSITWTSGSATITTGASDPGFTAQDIGKYVQNLDFTAGLPADARITAVASATSATISANATGNSSGNKPVALTLNPPSRETLQNNLLASRTANGFGQAGIGVGDLVIVALGVNDMAGIGTPPGTADRLADGLSAILDAYADNDAQADAVFLINPPGTHPDRTRAYALMAGMQKTVAEGWDAAVVDMWGLTRHSFAYAEATWDYFSDAVHPSDAGHQLIADQILKVVNP